MSFSIITERILLNQIIKDNLHWSGHVEMNHFPRLVTESNNSATQHSVFDEVYLDIKINADKRSQSIFGFELHACGQLPLNCQRCLHDFSQQITLNTKLFLLEDKSAVSLLEDDEDYVYLDELAGYSDKHGLNVLDVVEDELLLTLPTSPKHEDCDMILDCIGEIPEEDEQQDNPFALLANLKKTDV